MTVTFPKAFGWDTFAYTPGLQLRLEERFGRIFVDFPTVQRIPEDSNYWYKEPIAKGEIKY